MQIVPEQWRTIPEFEGKYEASNYGRVRSLDRIVVRANRWGECEHQWKGRVLKPVSHKGYLVTKLGACKYLFGIHQLVARAWYGMPNGLVVNHINGVKTDNRPCNLEYITNTENVKHAYRTGLLCNDGDQNGNSRAARKRRQLTKV